MIRARWPLTSETSMASPWPKVLSEIATTLAEPPSSLKRPSLRKTRPEDFDLKATRPEAAFDLERCKELERTLNHDVVAFTTNVSENIGAPASRWLHFGLTSSDIIDTAFAVQMVQSADLLLEGIRELRKVIAAKARKYA